MPDAPRRIQLRRTKGWRLPAGAVSVARPGPWGNPYRAIRRSDGWRVECSPRHDPAFKPRFAESERAALEVVCALYRDWVEPHAGVIRDALRGKSLACWCPPGQPCHADVLLELANAPLRCEAADA